MGTEAAAPGWYHAQGDPPNTNRWWNGNQWVGDPQMIADAQPFVSFPAAPVANSGDERTPIDWVIHALRRWSVADGRACRSEYWWFTLAYMLIGAALAIPALVLTELGSGAAIIFWLLFVPFVLAMIVPVWTVTIRRLHDTGRSGWWMALGMIPVINNVGSFVLLVFYCMDSEKHPNQWGESPKYGAASQLPATLQDSTALH